jgi:hypothetical protein
VLWEAACPETFGLVTGCANAATTTTNRAWCVASAKKRKTPRSKQWTHSWHQIFKWETGCALAVPIIIKAKPLVTSAVCQRKALKLSFLPKPMRAFGLAIGCAMAVRTTIMPAASSVVGAKARRRLMMMEERDHQPRLHESAAAVRNDYDDDEALSY